MTMPQKCIEPNFCEECGRAIPPHEDACQACGSINPTFKVDTASEAALYERCYQAALLTVDEYPSVAARALADMWLETTMLDVLRGTLQ